MWVRVSVCVLVRVRMGAFVCEGACVLVLARVRLYVGVCVARVLGCIRVRVCGREFGWLCVCACWRARVCVRFVYVGACV